MRCSSSFVNILGGPGLLFTPTVPCNLSCRVDFVTSHLLAASLILSFASVLSWSAFLYLSDLLFF